MFGAVLRALPIVFFLVAAGGGPALETEWAVTSSVNVLADSQCADQETPSTRPRAGVSALRQSSRQATAPAGSLAVSPPAEALAFLRPSLDIAVRIHLPFCITPRPPPLSSPVF
jgi:hypothetical protein